MLHDSIYRPLSTWILSLPLSLPLFLLIIAIYSSFLPPCVHVYLTVIICVCFYRWDKSLGGRRIALFHFPAKDESELRLVVGDELQLRLDAGAARLYG